MHHGCRLFMCYLVVCAQGTQCHVMMSPCSSDLSRTLPWKPKNRLYLNDLKKLWGVRSCCDFSNQWFSSLVNTKVDLRSFPLSPGPLGEWLASPWRRPNRSSKPAALGLARRRSSTRTSTWPSTTQVGTRPAVAAAAPHRRAWHTGHLSFRLQSSLSPNSSMWALHQLAKPFKNPCLPIWCWLVARYIAELNFVGRKRYLAIAGSGTARTQYMKSSPEKCEPPGLWPPCWDWSWANALAPGSSPALGLGPGAHFKGQRRTLNRELGCRWLGNRFERAQVTSDTKLV